MNSFDLGKINGFISIQRLADVKNEDVCRYMKYRDRIASEDAKEYAGNMKTSDRMNRQAE
jgi:hypothetical protein